jgi:hypothetical protein
MNELIKLEKKIVKAKPLSELEEELKVLEEEESNLDKEIKLIEEEEK